MKNVGGHWPPSTRPQHDPMALPGTLPLAVYTAAPRDFHPQCFFWSCFLHLVYRPPPPSLSVVSAVTGAYTGDIFLKGSWHSLVIPSHNPIGHPPPLLLKLSISLCHFPVVWPWVSWLTALSFNLLICETEPMRPTFQDG